MENMIVEHWESSEGNREDHYQILKNGKMEYFFGYNPAKVTQEQLDQIFKILGLKE